MRCFVLTFCSVLCAVGAAEAQFQSLWMQTYNPPRGALASGLALDAEGNVCVLADSFGEIAVVKYSPAGTPLWTNRYDSPLSDSAGGLAIDPANAIIVSGVSSTNGAPPISVVLKYAPDGDLLWARTGDVPGAPALATDLAGNVWTATVTTSGYMLIKYNPEGLPLWTNAYPLKAGYYAATIYFRVDTNGNAALVARLSNIGKDQMLVLKCSSAGALTSTVSEWPQANDFLTAATFDSAGNLFVAASVMTGSPLRYHLFVAKYDATGTLLWSNLRPPANGYNAVSRRIALDSAGNVIVSGYETRPVSEDEDETQALTLKYNPAGDELWVARANSFDRYPNGLAIDGNDNIYVVGDDSSLGAASFLLKYRPNGSQAAEALVPGSYSPGQIVIGTTGEVHLNLGWGAQTRKFSHADDPSSVNATIVPKLTEAFPGSSVTFTALVSGAGPFTYDWRYFGYKTGGTNATFTVTNAQYAWGNHGDYTVIVSNATSYTISPEARLTVLQDPNAITSPAFGCISRTNDQIVITWEGVPGLKLQRSSSLGLPVWTDVPNTEGGSAVQLMVTGEAGFFRLTKP